MKACRAVFECHSLAAVAELVNDHDNPAWVAGTWAYQAADEAGYGVTPENIRAHLEYLSDEGAAFDEAKAVEVALAIHAASVEQDAQQEQPRFALIEAISGFVWWVGEADSPEAACQLADTETGNQPHGEYRQIPRREAANGYFVFSAPKGFEVNDGQASEEIQAVLDLELVGRYTANRAL